jgi:hypothetical protein
MASSSARPERENPWASGLVLFAGIMIIVNGMFMILQGIAAIANDDWFVKGTNYTYNIDITGWGWIHLVIGIVLILVGFGVVSGNLFARITGMIVVVFVMVDNFLFIPYYPFWSLLMIALDVAILWALATATVEA